MTSDDLLFASLIRSLAITTEDVMARAWRPASREGTGTDQERSAGRGRGRGGGGRGGGRGGRGLGRGGAGMREDAPTATRSGWDEGGVTTEGEGALDGIDLAGLGIDAPGAVTR